MPRTTLLRCCVLLLGVGLAAHTACNRSSTGVGPAGGGGGGGGGNSSPPDVTPPVVWGDVGNQPDTMLASVALVAGESAQAHLYARDDRRVAWIGYHLQGSLGGQVGDLWDSVQVGDSLTGVEATVALALPAGATGWLTLAAFAVDGAGNRAVTTVIKYRASIYQYASPTLESVTLGTIEDWVYDAKRQRVYLTRPGNSQILVLDPATMTVDSALEAPGLARGLDLTVGGDSLLVALDSVRSVAVLDLGAPGAGWGSIALPAAPDTVSPLFLRVAATGRVLVTLATPDRQATSDVLELDLATGVDRLRTDLPGIYPAAAFLSASGDRKHIVVIGQHSVESYDAVTDAFGTGLGPGMQTLGTVSSDSLGSHLLLEGNFASAQLTDFLFSLPVYYGAAQGVADAPFVLTTWGDSAYFFSNLGGITLTRLSDGVTQQVVRLSPLLPMDRMMLVRGPHPRLLLSNGATLSSFALDSLPPLSSAPAGRSARVRARLTLTDSGVALLRMP